MTAAVVISSEGTPAQRVARRLLPLQVGAGLQAFLLWAPIEKLFMTEIGFTAASIGVMAAVYAAVVPLLEVPSGILADRSSRRWLLALASVAMAASSLIGAVSHAVLTYMIAAVFLGVALALDSGTADSIIYDTVLEETGSGDSFEIWIGRLRIIESASLVVSAILGGLLAGWASTRLTYWVSVPVALLSGVAFLLLREPRLHRQGRPAKLREHVGITFRVMTRNAPVRRALLLVAVTGVVSQLVFEFGALWLVALDAPAAIYGPHWAILVSTLGVGGYLVSKLQLRRRPVRVLLAGIVMLAPLPLTATGSIPVVIAAQTLLTLGVAVVGIYASALLHDAVDSHVRAGVASGAGTLTWLLFLPLSLLIGWIARYAGIGRAGWLLVAVSAALAMLLARSSRGVVAEAPAAELPEPVRTAPTDAATPAEVDPIALILPPIPAEANCRDLVGMATGLLDGDLPEHWAARLRAHLAGCDGCTAYIAQMRTVLDTLEQLANTPD
jgi:MFS family permease